MLDLKRRRGETGPYPRREGSAMPILGQTPGKGRGFITYTHDKSEPGSKRTGFLAGAVHGLTCHPGKKTKPCTRALCGNAARCAGCEQHQPAAWCGYVPLRDTTGRPVCIIIREAVIDVVEKIKPSARVMWGRDDDEFGPVWLVEWHQGAEWSRWWPDKKANDDMAPWLCSLWRMPELLPYLRALFAGELKPASCEPTPIPPALTSSQTPAWVKGVANSLVQSELGESLGEVFKRRGIDTEATAPHSNGKKKR